jgi:hypothetical protein
VQVENIRVPEYAFTFSIESRILQPDESTQVRFSGAIHQDGTFTVFPIIQLLDARRNVVYQDVTDITFEVSKGSFRKIALADLTARRARGSSARGAKAALPKAQRLNPSLPLPVGFTTPEPSVAQLESLPRAMMERIPLTVGGSTADAEPSQPSSARRLTSRTQFPLATPQQTNQPRSGTMLLKGALRYKSVNTSWNPAYGWVAKVTVLDKNQKYVTLGRRELDWSGKWSFTVPGQWAGYAVQVDYEMANGFFVLRDPDYHATYHLALGNVAKVELGTTEDIGLQGVDLSKSNTGFVGLGDIYNEGMRLWLAMVNVGISPRHFSDQGHVPQHQAQLW